MQDKSHAYVVLPFTYRAAAVSGLKPANRRWLAGARLQVLPATEPLLALLSVLGLPTLEEGLGALRLWGETGERPDGWVACADPVYLEARLNQVVLHPMHPPEVRPEEVREVFAHLQRRLGDDKTCEFFAVGTTGYLHREQPMATAQVSPLAACGDAPGDYMPDGPEALQYDRLQTEVQMSLYESELNQRRANSGLRPLNALWLWGGGVAPGRSTVRLPRLYADDPLFRGFWHMAAADSSRWPPSAEVLGSGSPFVAVMPRATVRDDGPDEQVSFLRRLLERGRLRSMTLLFTDGTRADMHRWDKLRFWRRSFSPHQGPAPR